MIPHAPSPPQFEKEDFDEGESEAMYTEYEPEFLSVTQIAASFLDGDETTNPDVLAAIANYKRGTNTPAYEKSKESYDAQFFKTIKEYVGVKMLKLLMIQPARYTGGRTKDFLPSTTLLVVTRIGINTSSSTIVSSFVL